VDALVRVDAAAALFEQRRGALGQIAVLKYAAAEHDLAQAGALATARIQCARALWKRAAMRFVGTPAATSPRRAAISSAQSPSGSG